MRCIWSVMCALFISFAYLKPTDPLLCSDFLFVPQYCIDRHGRRSHLLDNVWKARCICCETLHNPLADSIGSVWPGRSEHFAGLCRIYSGMAAGAGITHSKRGGRAFVLEGTPRHFQRHIGRSDIDPYDVVTKVTVAINRFETFPNQPSISRRVKASHHSEPMNRFDSEASGTRFFCCCKQELQSCHFGCLVLVIHSTIESFHSGRYVVQYAHNIIRFRTLSPDW